MKRTDDFQERRAHLANLTDDQLEARFWELANKLGCIEHNLIAHGAGNVIYRLAKAQNSEIRPAGLALADGKLWDEAEKLFDGGNN